MQLVVEERLLSLECFCISQGYVGRLKEGTEAILTTFRIQYKLGGSTEQILISGIRKCQLTKRLLTPCVRLECIDSVYSITCDNLQLFYDELQRVLALNVQSQVLNTQSPTGGISRIMDMQRDKNADIEAFGVCSLSDLDTLRAKSAKLLDVVKQNFGSSEATITQMFEALNVTDAFQMDDNPETVSNGQIGDEVQRALEMLMHSNDLVLLQDLFCAVNRLRLSDLISPQQVYDHVLVLEENGVCSCVNFKGVMTIFPPSGTTDSKDVIDLLSKRPMNLCEFAKERQVSLPLAEYKLLLAEENGHIVRDESLANICYHVNSF